MAFLTPEQIREVRCKGSRLIAVDEIGKSLRLLKMSGACATKAEEFQTEVEAGKRKKTDLFHFMLQNVCADEAGNLLTPDDATTLVELLSLESLTKLLAEINDFLSIKAPTLGK